MGSKPQATSTTNGIIHTVGSTGRCTLYGVTLYESAGSPAAAVVNIRQGSATGAILCAIKLAASGTLTQWFGPQGIQCVGNLYCEIASGSVTGSVLWG